MHTLTRTLTHLPPVAGPSCCSLRQAGTASTSGARIMLLRRTTTAPFLRSQSTARAAWSLARSAAPASRPFARAFSSSGATRADGSAAGADEGEKKIIEILNEKFNPSQLEVSDTSGTCCFIRLDADVCGPIADKSTPFFVAFPRIGGCGSFYSIVISSKKFAGVPTIKAHRMINQELKNIISGIHGLQVSRINAE